VLYDDTGERWYEWPAIRLPFAPEMWLVPLFGHTRGHCGVAIQMGSGWLFHVGDAAPIELAADLPPWLVRLVLGPHAPRLRAFRESHPEIRMTTGHVTPEFFREGTP
jgi:hypothetical protein